MKPSKIEGARRTLGIPQQVVADALGIAISTYRKKASTGKFTDDEKLTLSNLFGFDFNQFNDVFYNGSIPSP